MLIGILTEADKPWETPLSPCLVYYIHQQINKLGKNRAQHDAN